MDLAGLKTSGRRFIDKYKYALLVLLLGIVLMSLPTKKESANNSIDVVEENTEAEIVHIDREFR